MGRRIFGTFQNDAKVVNSLFGETWRIAGFEQTNCQLGFERYRVFDSNFPGAAHYWCCVSACAMPSVDHPLGWCYRAMTSTHRRGMGRTKVDAHQTELTEHAASGTLGTR